MSKLLGTLHDHYQLCEDISGTLMRRASVLALVLNERIPDELDELASDLYESAQKLREAYSADLNQSLAQSEESAGLMLQVALKQCTDGTKDL